MKHLAWITEPDSTELDYLTAELAKLDVDVTDLGATARDRHTVDVLLPFVNTRVDAAMMDKLPALKLIATLSTGTDHIDLVTAGQRGILVRNVADYGSVAVAEYTFALMLRVTRPDDETGTDLSGKTLGVIGTGAIGRHVAGIAHGFGMNVIAYDLDRRPGLTYADGIEELLMAADIVTLHIPATPHTRHILNAKRIAMMKPGAYLVNTARGSLVDSRALADALRSGHIAGAGLDVMEPLDDSERGTSLPRTIVTPHNAYNTREATRRISDQTIRNVADFLHTLPE